MGTHRRSRDGTINELRVMLAVLKPPRTTAVLATVLLLAPASRADDAEAIQRRGERSFKAGRIRQSIADFDRYLELRPEREPHHWQRGISYYYAGEYEKGVRQFALHKTVNPQDVENAVWHYLCKARVDGADAARAELIEIARDPRPWAMPVYRMFQGKIAPKQVLAEAQAAGQTEAEQRNNLFYSHLYVGLYHEAAGQADLARRHITLAVEKYASPHYMGDVARVHLQLLKAKEHRGKDMGD